MKNGPQNGPKIIQNRSKNGSRKKHENQWKTGPPTFHVFLPIRGVRGVKYKIEKNAKKEKNKEKQTMKCKLDRKHPYKNPARLERARSKTWSGPGANLGCLRQ